MERETGRGERNENHHVIHDVKVVGATNMAAFRSQFKCQFSSSYPQEKNNRFPFSGYFWVFKEYP